MASPRVFAPLVARLGMLSLAPAGVAFWAGGPFAALGVGVGLLGVELWRVRRAMVGGMAERLEFAPSRAEDHPWLDSEGFRRELAALEELGFHAIADYSASYPRAPRGFARVLIHPGERVYAEVNQAKHNGTPLPVATSIGSVMSQGWTLQTTSRDAPPVATAFMRTPRTVWRSLSEAPPATLLADHLELRMRMCSDLDLEVAGDGTVHGYFDFQRDEHRARGEAMRRANVVAGIGRGLASERRRPHEWLGDYTTAATG